MSKTFIPKEFFKRVRALISNHVVVARQIVVKNAIDHGVPRLRGLQMTDTCR